MCTKVFTLLLLFLISACTTESTSSQDSEAKQWQQTFAQLTTLQKEGKTQEGITFTRQQLHLFLQIAQNTNQKDSLIQQINYLLSTSHHFYQTHAYVKEGIAYLDSLSQNPFLTKYCQHELLCDRASLRQLIGENQEAVRLADEYLLLPPNPDANAYIRQAEGISGVYVYSGNNLPKAIGLLEKAVNLYRKGAQYPNITMLMSRLGIYYRLLGEYEKAIAINQEAISNYNDSMHPRNLVIAYGEQANLYTDLGMHDHALQMSRKAQYYSMLKDSFGLGDVYRYRALIFREMDNKDSTWYYLNAAEKISALQNSYKGVFVSNVLKAEVYLDNPDSTQKALQIALSACPDSNRVPQWAKFQLDLQLGTALLKSGQEQKGLPLIEEAAQRLIDMDMPEGHNAAKTLMNYYLKKGMNDAFVRSYVLNQKMADSLQYVEKVRAVAAANIRFNTQQKEKENKLLSAQIDLQQQQLFYNICISIVLLLLLITFIAFFMNRRKANRLLIESNKREMQKLITRQQDLNRRNEQLTIQIEQAMASNNINTIRQLTGQSLLSKEDENEFRQSFATIYPSYLPNLRQHYPQLTRNEELLAMLICMNQSTDEIALIMGINRNSVNVVRSRMRKNMELAREVSLDEVIKQYLPK